MNRILGQSRSGPGVSQDEVVTRLQTAYHMFNAVHRPSIACKPGDDVVRVSFAGQFAQNGLLIVGGLDCLQRCLHEVPYSRFDRSAI